MKTSELKSRLSWLPSGYGHWRVTYRTPSGKEKTGVTTDSIAIDRLSSDLNEKEQGHYGYTYKQALLALKSVCK